MEGSITSHPKAGKERGAEGERRSDMLRLLKFKCKIEELNDSRRVRIGFKMLNNCLFSMVAH